MPYAMVTVKAKLDGLLFILFAISIFSMNYGKMMITLVTISISTLYFYLAFYRRHPSTSSSSLSMKLTKEPVKNKKINQPINEYRNHTLPKHRHQQIQPIYSTMMTIPLSSSTSSPIKTRSELPPPQQ
ncbi:cd36, variant 3 [Dermatophagoides farinae]|nr:cd36, variant 3 [Dermatophagoides farinae]